MSDLAAFLLARIAEDETAARDCARVYPGEWDLTDRGHTAYVRADEPAFHIVAELRQEQIPVGWLPWLGDGLAHVARWQPTRVLAECEAKRRIIELHHVECGGHPGSWMPHADYGPGYCWREDESNETLLALASIYADHPDYRQEWKP